MRFVPLSWTRAPLLPVLVEIPHQYRNALRFALVRPSKMCCAQVKPDWVLPSSQAGLNAPVPVDHSVSHTGLRPVSTVEVGGEAYPWLVNAPMARRATGSASTALV